MNIPQQSNISWWWP